MMAEGGQGGMRGGEKVRILDGIDVRTYLAH